MRVLALLLATIAAACAAVRPSFTFVEASTRTASLQIIGPRKSRIKAPKMENLRRQLAAAREQHMELSRQVKELDVAKFDAWAHPQLRKLKAQKLMAKDRIRNCEDLIHRLQRSDGEELGHGSFGRVLLGRSLIDGDNEEEAECAIKVIPLGDSTDDVPSQVASEASVLAAMAGEPGFPALRYHGKQELVLDGRPLPCEIVVMELLGPSLEELSWAASAGTCFSPGCVMRVAHQALERLQRLHDRGWVHLDISPAQFCVGASGQRRGTLYLVDFGTSARLDDDGAAYGQATPGSVEFASLGALSQSKTRGARDDVEALVYLLVYLAVGRLPWSAAETQEEVRAAKARCHREGGVSPATNPLFDSLPDELLEPLARLWEQVSAAPGSTVERPSSYDSAFAKACRDAIEPAHRRFQDAPFDWDK